MQFTLASPFHLASDCGCYSVAKVRRDAIWDYISWFTEKPKAVPVMLGASDTADQAKSLCESHSEAAMVRYG